MENNDTLNKWLSLVSSQDMDGVVGMYAEDGVLLGTYSDKVRIGKDSIKEYFQDFLSKKPEASLIDATTHYVLDRFYVMNGFYDFKIESGDGNKEIIHARFTFVFENREGNFQIISHHSSIIPN
tara:strand:+ start:291 stop:662 length:372 start_codon:yes stop_codon:yes gene_type:complete